MLIRALSLLSPAARRRFAVLVVAMAAAALLEVATIGSVTLCMARLGDRATGLAIAALILLVLSNLTAALVGYALVRFAVGQERELSARLLEGYLRQPYAWWLGQNSAVLQQNVMSGVIARGVLEPLTTGVSRLILAFCLIVMLIAVQPGVALWTALTLGLAYALLSFLTRRFLGHLAGSTQRAVDRASQTSQEAMTGIKTLTVLGRQQELVRRYRESGQDISRNQAAWSLASDLPRHLLETVAVGGILGLALYLSSSGQETGEILALLSLYALAGYRLIPALHLVFTSWSRLVFSTPTLERFHAGLQVPEEASPGPPVSFQQSLSASELTFTYPGAPAPSLDRVSLELPRNGSLGLVGVTGCGKTTLVDVLLGLLTPQSGVISLDGRPLEPGQWPAWQRKLGYVPQDPFLSDASILENIALGVAEPNPEEAERAARLANLHDFIVGLPQGYFTLVGERGVRLSGGQRQRLAIARALYHDPEMLVMDEATSALDTPTERAIQESVGALTGRKTLLVVAHRLETVRDLDRIALMQDGRILACGPYGQLLEESELFRALASV